MKEIFEKFCYIMMFLFLLLVFIVCAGVTIIFYKGAVLNNRNEDKSIISSEQNQNKFMEENK